MSHAYDTPSLRRLFYAGKHQEVLTRTLDQPDPQLPAAEVPCVVGALALLGRVDEALACMQGDPIDRALDASQKVEGAFFVIVGLCHAGRYTEAELWCKRSLALRDRRDAKLTFFVFQSLALVRYFAGRMRRALFWGKCALAASVRARFNYGRLLALDLWGHSLVQLGEVSAGLRTLGQAERLASSLSYDGHATSIACSRLIYQSQHGRGGMELEEALTTLAVASTDNLYVLRAAWLELGFRAAIHGDAARARTCLERAAAQAVPERDERARTRLLLTTAILRSIDHSRAEAARCIVQAEHAAARSRDRLLQAEVRCWDHVLGTACLAFERAEAERAARETGSLMARCLLALREPSDSGHQIAHDSPLWSLLLGAVARGGDRAPGALRHSWYGLCVILLGAEPSRRIWLLDDALLADDHGVVVHVAKAPGHALELLRALGHGEQTKAALIKHVWRVATYSPAHHDAVIYTAMARMRRALGPSGEWVRTSALGYALAPGVVVAELARPHPHPHPHPPQPMAAEAPRALVDAQTSLEHALAGGLERSSTELAQLLGLSEATMLRRLRQLAADGVVRRSGAGKNTRYRLAYAELN